jgi:hypothetical protein
MAEQQCQTFAIALVWHAEERWNHLSNQQALHTYRIIEQAMSNAIQHGAPDTISITLTSSDQDFVAQIHDNGGGFDSTQTPTAGHYGIESMHERARSLQGDLRIESKPGSGTTIQLQIPINPQQATAKPLPHAMQQIKPKQPTAKPAIFSIRQRILLATACVAILTVLFFQLLPEDPTCVPNRQLSSQRFFVSASNQANKTGICVSPGDTIIIQYISGVWSTDNRRGLVDAEGYLHYQESAMLNTARLGMLIGKIGSTTSFIAIAKEYRGVVHTTGELILTSNDVPCDGCYADNSGILTVEITHIPAKP